MKFEKHILINDADSTSVNVLANATELSKQHIKQAMTKGAVWLTRNQATQRIRRADKTLRIGDNLHIYYDEKILQQKIDDAVLVADEKMYSIWHKPYGMLSQGSKWGDHCTLNRWVEKNLQPQRPAFIVHRLDRAATGLMIIAHSKKCAAYFSKLFQDRQIEKHYQAIVHGHFPEYRLLNSEIDKKPALSHVRHLEYDAKKDLSVVTVSIETGRKHQIRIHLSNAGFAIVGDRLYGEIEVSDEQNLCLTSCFLSLISPADDEKKSYSLPDRYHLHLNSVQ